jgi:hypothetical protein
VAGVIAVGLLLSAGRLGDTNRTSAAPALCEEVLTLADLEGTIDPITYTDPDGTFTISDLTLTLDPGTPSTVTIDPTTGLINNTLTLVVAFNNGKPPPLNADLSGILTMNESGQLLPPDDPFCQQFPEAYLGCADLVVTNGVLTGAGPFNGTVVKGDNPTIIPFPPAVIWRFSPPDSPPHLLIDLPSPPFIGGQNTVIHGELIARLDPPFHPPVGGLAELPDASGSAGRNYVALAALAAALGALGAGGWYARTRWVR